MPIVTLSDGLIKRLKATDGRILRDRAVCGLCLKLGKRTRTFLVATSIAGRQFRMTLGRWPLLSVDDARSVAIAILRDCRNGQIPTKQLAIKLPVLTSAVTQYCGAKRLKPSSLERYLSVIRTHFTDWQNSCVNKLSGHDFSEHCHKFTQSVGSAVVDLGRGLIGALFKYLNATYGLALISPFIRLAAAGLMPERAQPRKRTLLECDLSRWSHAVSKLPEKQRDYLLLLAYTGLRRNECVTLEVSQIDFNDMVFYIPDTKTGSPHSLPVTSVIEEIMRRRIASADSRGKLFSDVSADHVNEMAQRCGAPKFMLHDLRKLLATIAEKLGLSDAIKRRILNHAAKRGDTLHRHYVSLDANDIRQPLIEIQTCIQRLMVLR